MSGPADGDDQQQARDDQPNGGHQTHFGFDFFVFDEGGEVGAGAQNEQGQDSEHAADDGHGTGRLEVRAQDEQRVVGFTLLLSGTLNHTLHPQALFLNLCGKGNIWNIPSYP